MIEEYSPSKKELIRNRLDFILIIVLILLGIILVFFIFKIKTDGARCVSNTLQYTTEHLEKSTGGNVTCTCLTDNPKSFVPGSGRGYKIIFGSHGIGEEIE